MGRQRGSVPDLEKKPGLEGNVSEKAVPFPKASDGDSRRAYCSYLATDPIVAMFCTMGSHYLPYLRF